MKTKINFRGIAVLFLSLSLQQHYDNSNNDKSDSGRLDTNFLFNANFVSSLYIPICLSLKDLKAFQHFSSSNR
ncbi:CLUMA_CG016902, isoform A [Clunio marinus]|uniref:CLUMA_CG016902, isoform A n=1 Tax=Clunio marinus TaxID=568069 RepID=A0A1J1IX55_9DIPT|nr:CLUMA_CG016902, isoform A [Clunio marinus]